MALEMPDAVSGVPFWVEQHRQVVKGDHGRQVARQRNVVGFMVEVAATGLQVLAQLSLDPELTGEARRDDTSVDQPKPPPALSEPCKEAGCRGFREQQLLACTDGPADPGDDAVQPV